jgi:hypothetical protein
MSGQFKALVLVEYGDQLTVKEMLAGDLLRHVIKGRE